MHQTSASQIETFLDCERKFWFTFIVKMPREQNTSFTFGEVMHGVIERWLKADDLGNGPELYPDGWSDELTVAEADLIRRLVTAGIAEGVIARQPGRAVEEWISMALVEHLGLRGKIDVFDYEGIEDHKSAKNTRYLETPKTLASNTQLLIYAKWWLEEHRKAGATPPAAIKLRHNQFIKDFDKPSVRSAEARVSAEVVDSFWNKTILPAAEKIRKAYDLNVPMKEWATVAGPKSVGVCKKYGGCPFASVCGKLESPEALHARLSQMAKPPDQPTQEKPMSIFAKNRKPNAPAPTPAAPAAETVTPPSVAVSESVADGVAPWAYEKCPTCKGVGINPRTHQPCHACNLVHTQRGLPTIGLFTWTIEDGVLYWRNDATKVAGQRTLSPSVSAPAAKVAETVTEVPDYKVVEVEANPTTIGQIPAAELVAEHNQTLTEGVLNVEEKSKPQKTPQPTSKYPAFTLVVGGGLTTNLTVPIVSLDKLHAEVGAKLAELGGKSSYYELDTWKRKDNAIIHALEMVKTLPPGCIIMASGRDLETQALVAALRPLAAMVFQGYAA